MKKLTEEQKRKMRETRDLLNAMFERLAKRPHFAGPRTKTIHDKRAEANVNLFTK